MDDNPKACRRKSERRNQRVESAHAGQVNAKAMIASADGCRLSKRDKLQIGPKAADRADWRR